MDIQKEFNEFIDGENEKAFDYMALRKERTVPAVADALAIFGKHSEKLAFDNDIDPEEAQKIISEVAQDIINALVERNVHFGEMDYFFQSIQIVVGQVLQRIVLHKNEIMEEKEAREFGVKNPGNGKYDKHFVTFSDLFSQLDTLRKEQDKEGENNYKIVVSHEETNTGTN